jgi:Flp pilus assembly protein TadD
VRLNLALVVGLRGHVAEAESIVREGRSPEEAAANVADLRHILARRANTRSDAETTASIGVARPN